MAPWESILNYFCKIWCVGWGGSDGSEWFGIAVRPVRQGGGGVRRSIVNLGGTLEQSCVNFGFSEFVLPFLHVLVR